VPADSDTSSQLPYREQTPLDSISVHFLMQTALAGLLAAIAIGAATAAPINVKRNNRIVASLVALLL